MPNGSLIKRKEDEMTNKRKKEIMIICFIAAGLNLVNAILASITNQPTTANVLLAIGFAAAGLLAWWNKNREE